MKNNRFIRITTIAFALTVLAGYVVYSQRQYSRSVTRIPFPAATNNTVAQTNLKAATNPAAAQKSALVASGSKSKAPLFEVRADQRGMVAPGSKSAAVFDLRGQAQSPHPNLPLIVTHSRPNTNPATAKSQAEQRSAQQITSQSR